MYKLLVMTDLHLLEAGGDIIGLDPTANFNRALDHALIHHPDAKRLILTGDLTHHGKVAQYNVLKEALQFCPIPVSFLIGNHDIRENFFDVFPAATKDKNGFLQSAMVHGDDVWITLDTKHDDADEAEKHCGMLCTARLEWLKAQLAQHSDKRAIVFMHHPPFDVGFVGMDRIKLLNGPEVLDVMRRHPCDIHLIAGHVHRTISGTASGVGFSMYKSTCHQMPMVLGSDDTSLSVPEPAAYGVIFADKNSIIAHTEDFDIAMNSADPKDGID